MTGEIQLDLRSLIEHFKENRALITRKNLDPVYEVALAIRQAQPHPILAETTKGQLVSNIFADRKNLYLVLNAENDQQAYQKLLKASTNPTPLETIEPRGYKSIGDDALKLPIPTFYEKDAGPYITAGIFIARNLYDGAINASIHRALLLDENTLAIRVVPRHLHHILSQHEKHGKNLPVAILIGAPPVTYIAASTSPPYGVYEIEVANTLANGKLQATTQILEGTPLPLPTEIIILGHFQAGKRAKEGPFVDITGTYDEVRQQPVYKIEEILVRQNPIYYAILPAGLEHIHLMGFPREAAIWEATRKVTPTVQKVRLTKGGVGWLSAVITMDKHTEGDPKNVIMAAFAAHPSLKMVTVVDTDIDPDNPSEVEWALATRMQPHEDIIIIKNARGSSLDPSADQHRLLTSKIGIDATRPLDKDPQLFEKAKIPAPKEQD